MKVGAPVVQASRNKENIRSCMGKNCNIIIIVICLPYGAVTLIRGFNFVTTCHDQSHTTPCKRWTGTRDRMVNNQIWLPGGGRGIRISSLMCMPQKSRKKQNLFQL